MPDLSKQPLRFSREAADFYQTLRKRANQYFEENNISKHANSQMVLKTITMILLYVVPFLALLFFVNNSLIFILMWFLMGLGAAGIGLCVMHDANHGAYSSNKYVNLILGNITYILGACASHWKLQHNVLHHTYTNVDGYDHDLSAPILRFSPHTKKLKIHRFQHYYAWVMYSLMTISWSTIKEFKQVGGFKKMGLIKSSKKYWNLFLESVFGKIFYFGVFLVLPALITPFSFWFVLLGFVIMHIVTGLLLSLVFQPAHVILNTEFPLPDEKGNLENNWAIHQILTTANFAGGSKFFTWVLGGLNYQIEHHLFPSICHVHYPKLSEIVEQTAKEFNLPYYSEKTWWSAIANHGKMLRQLAHAA
ncbi:MAG: acyl-CoA desaturase [Saprospirales bacterium]|nr:MAG: acyl-CoA desaturase [Saprospirales bacterium]